MPGGEWGALAALLLAALVMGALVPLAAPVMGALLALGALLAALLLMAALVTGALVKGALAAAMLEVPSIEACSALEALPEHATTVLLASVVTQAMPDAAPVPALLSDDLWEAPMVTTAAADGDVLLLMDAAL